MVRQAIARRNGGPPPGPPPPVPAAALATDVAPEAAERVLVCYATWRSICATAASCSAISWSRAGVAGPAHPAARRPGGFLFGFRLVEVRCGGPYSSGRQGRARR